MKMILISMNDLQGLKKEFEVQLKEEEKLNTLIIENLAKVVVNNGQD
ncbi:MAG: hypothetical protein ROZ36_07955 [Thermincola sp.]|nr:hypothetical protein [Thermincola sp.]